MKLFLFILTVSEFFSGLQTTIAAAAERCKKNDDYCDCGDDEILTSACSLYKASNRLFQCRDQQVLQMLFLSRVNDLVCDCCDGSDELPNAQCPNTCQQVARDVAAELQETKARFEQGVTEREVLVREASEKLAMIREGGAGAQMLLDTRREPLVQAKSSLEREEKLEKEMRASALTVGANVFNKYFERFSKEDLARIVATLTLLKTDSGVEAVLVEIDEKFEDEGPDPDDSLAFQLVTEHEYQSEDDISSPTAVEVDSAGQPLPSEKRRLSIDHVDAMVQALSLHRLSVQSLMEVIQQAVARFAVTNEENSEENTKGPSFQVVSYLFEAIGATSVDPKILESFPISPVIMERQPYVRHEASQLRQEIAQLESEIKQIRHDLASGEEVKNIDFGERGWLYALWGKCYRWTQPSGDMYTYEVCPFKQAKQTSTLLGRYEKAGLLTQNADAENYVRDDGVVVAKEKSRGRPYLMFSNGERCFATGRPRSFVLHLECSAIEEEMEAVGEPETCFYTATVKTPLACM